MVNETGHSPIDQSRKKAEETAEAAKSRAASLKDDAADSARSVASSARSRAESEVNTRFEGARDTVAGAIDDTAETLRTAAERMSDGTPQTEAVNRAANTVSGFATQVRETDMASLTDDVTGLARRYPVPFLAGAAALGFAAGRFLRASSRGPRHDDGYDRSYEDDLAPPPGTEYRPTASAHTPSHADRPRSFDAPAGTAGATPRSPAPAASGTASSAAAGSTGGVAPSPTPTPPPVSTSASPAEPPRSSTTGPAGMSTPGARPATPPNSDKET
jgi:hypothetical protein